MEASLVNGAAKTLLNFCDSLALPPQRTGSVSMAIATFHRGDAPSGQPANAFVAAVESRGIRAFVIPERYRFDPRSLRALRAVITEANPDIIETNNVKSHALIKMMGLHRKRRWLAFHHGHTVPDFKMKLYNQLDRWSLPSAHRVLAVCGPLREQLLALGVRKDRIRVLHNSAAVLKPGWDHSAPQVRKKFGLQDPATAILLSIGRLSSEKGHADLIDALHHLHHSRPSLNWRLLLVGSGPEQHNLEAAVQRFGLQGHVIFASQQADVLPFYGAANAMVLPSHAEGSPHVVLEAMSAGVPIVATSVGGVPEMLRDGETGLLTPAKDPEALAFAIARILDSPWLADSLAVKAKEELRVRFSHEAYRRTLLEIYEELLAAPPVGARSRKSA